VEYGKRSEAIMLSIEKAQSEMANRGKIAEAIIASKRPDLLDIYLTYQNEAIAARKILNTSLIELNAGAEILEVGGGITALAIQLESEGFKVTSVEPVGEGFSEISFIIKVFIEIARFENLNVKLVQSSIEDCTFNNKFDFIFSINVMEHLKNPYSVLLQLAGYLKSGARYRFLCPNYDFPYEPHFAKWMYVRKQNAFYLSLNGASNSTIELSDSNALYRSINFITLKKLKIVCYENNLSFVENSLAFYELLIRATEDIGLKIRHPALHSIVLQIEKWKFLKLAKYFPVNFQPTIDIEIVV
jgi:2-polyprenyl-3-methyl-5-hydroxy-6-metoxy-1,4-benzoquinol methylase